MRSDTTVGFLYTKRQSMLLMKCEKIFLGEERISMWDTKPRIWANIFIFLEDTFKNSENCFVHLDPEG